jgi:acid phosphatase
MFCPTATPELFRSLPAASGSFLSSLAPGFLSSKQDKARGETHFVRMRYNGQAMKLPACAPQGLHLEGHEEVCTLEGFRRALKGVEMTGKEWNEGCAYVAPQEKEKP